MRRYHRQCAPVNATERHDMDDARLKCAGCGRTTYGVNWVVEDEGAGWAQPPGNLPAAER